MLYLLNSYKTVKIDEDELVLKRKSMTMTIQVFGPILFVTFFCLIKIFNNINLKDGKGFIGEINILINNSPFWWFVILLPIIVICAYLPMIMKMLKGEMYRFSNVNNVVFKNSKKIIDYSLVQNLLINVSSKEGDPERIREHKLPIPVNLSLVLKNGKKIKIIDVSNINNVRTVAKELSLFIKKDIIETIY